jgi:hypothetical protein
MFLCAQFQSLVYLLYFVSGPKVMKMFMSVIYKCSL